MPLTLDDEMMSDSLPYALEDDVVYKVTTKVRFFKDLKIGSTKYTIKKMIVKTEGDYNTAGDDLGEKYDPTSTTVNNLVDAHRLVVRFCITPATLDH